MSRLACWFDAKCDYWNGYYRALLRSFGLSGRDGDLSFSKAVCLSVLFSYLLTDNLPASVAIALIAASFGVKVFLEFLKAWKRKEDDVRPSTDERG